MFELEARLDKEFQDIFAKKGLYFNHKDYVHIGQHFFATDYTSNVITDFVSEIAQGNYFELVQSNPEIYELIHNIPSNKIEYEGISTIKLDNVIKKYNHNFNLNKKDNPIATAYWAVSVANNPQSEFNNIVILSAVMLKPIYEELIKKSKQTLINRKNQLIVNEIARIADMAPEKIMHN